MELRVSKIVCVFVQHFQLPSICRYGPYGYQQQAPVVDLGMGNYNYGYPQQPQYYPQQPQQAAPGPNQPGAAQSQPAANNTNSKPGKKTKSKAAPVKPNKSSGTTKSPKTAITTTTPTSPQSDKNSSEISDRESKIRDLIKDLKDEDFEMETPTAAMFTLVVGMTISISFSIFAACYFRGMRRRGRRRNLATDAERDYLVNGMYL